ncbi:CLUMA_CG001814, isoform A [Clunio marinus]|uniref:CLUMA_CG001814, isoform A n=1 Tax=Clunio marinus TaxID=568069 RepID=A0A1J1HKU9_9DIPT|nr:CLUMA_CG001814, isoform A [Clunio marinus]
MFFNRKGNLWENVLTNLQKERKSITVGLCKICNNIHQLKWSETSLKSIYLHSPLCNRFDGHLNSIFIE